jgi:hypothetical protein
VSDTNINLSEQVGDTLPVGNGGTGTTSISGVVKGNGSSAMTAAVAGTDYAPATSGSSILKASGSGGFSNAVAGTDYVSPSGTETLTNKSLTTPKIDQVRDTNNNVILHLQPIASAVNYVEVDNAATGNDPTIYGWSLTDTNVNLNLATKGFGVVKANSVEVATRANASGQLQPVQWLAENSLTYTISSGSVTQISGTTVDGGSPAVGDRIAIVGAPASTGTGTTNSNAAANGIYIVTGNTTNLSVTRTADMSGTVVPWGMNFVVTKGNNAGYTFFWTVGTGGSFTWGTTTLKYDGFINMGDQFLGRVADINHAQTLTNKTFGAGTTTVPPFTITSGTNLTTAAAGAVEYDGKVFYATPAASTRQVLDGEQFITLTSSRTLTSNTSAQAIFNSPSSGTVTLVGSTTYFFECLFSVTGLSTSSHTISFGFGGTGTITRQLWQAETVSTAGTFTTPAAAVWSQQTATAAIIAAQTTNNAVQAQIRGKLVIGTGGTLIPQITQNTASAAAVIGNDSYFRIWAVGSNTVQSVGNWS